MKLTVDIPDSVVSLVPEKYRKDEDSLSELVVSFFSAAVKSTCSVSRSSKRSLFAGGPLFPIGKKPPTLGGDKRG